MAFKQFLGIQGKSQFILRNISSGAVIYSVVINNTCPEISFSLVGEIPQNFRGDNIDMSKGVNIKFSLEIYNVNVSTPTWTEILTLIKQINLLRRYKTLYALKAYPYYNSNSCANWGFDVLCIDDISTDNIKKFINNGQKLQISFISKYVQEDVPELFQSVSGTDEIIISSTNQNTITI